MCVVEAMRASEAQLMKKIKQQGYWSANVQATVDEMIMFKSISRHQ